MAEIPQKLELNTVLVLVMLGIAAGGGGLGLGATVVGSNGNGASGEILMRVEKSIDEIKGTLDRRLEADTNLRLVVTQQGGQISQIEKEVAAQGGHIKALEGLVNTIERTLHRPPLMEEMP